MGVLLKPLKESQLSVYVRIISWIWNQHSFIAGITSAGACGRHVICPRKSDRGWEAGHGRNHGCPGLGTEGGDDHQDFIPGGRTDQLPAWKLSEGDGGEDQQFIFSKSRVCQDNQY